MSEQQQVIQKDPPQLPGIPQVPIPQTNSGTLEHTGIPFQQVEMITDIPPDYAWMSSQWKYIDQFQIKQSDPIGALRYQTLVINNTGQFSDKYFANNWMKLPLQGSYWWTGAISYRFTAIKPPRVTGKLLVRFRQDAFQNLGTTIADEYPSDTPDAISDKLYRSILKEWDLSQSSQFEFDITSAIPIRARPSRFAQRYTATGENSWQETVNAFDPWTEIEMGRIIVEVAQHISPGGIFPDTFTVLVEKSIKNPKFYSTTDYRSKERVILDGTQKL